MTSAVVVSPTRLLLAQRRDVRRDRQVRSESRAKRAEILDQISRHPDADEGLRQQARLYRERLEAGMDGATGDA